MQKEEARKYGLNINQATGVACNSAMRSVTFESESLSLLGAFACIIGLLMILADVR